MARGKKTGKEPKRKPGNKGVFFHAHYDFLNSHLNEFYEAATAGTTSEFFDKYLAEYWKMFP